MQELLVYYRQPTPFPRLQTLPDQESHWAHSARKRLLYPLHVSVRGSCHASPHGLTHLVRRGSVRLAFPPSSKRLPADWATVSSCQASIVHSTSVHAALQSSLSSPCTRDKWLSWVSHPRETRDCRCGTLLRLCETCQLESRNRAT